ncbi:MAG: hypothetical protein KME54_21630 [Tolypothrix brevis GSE-NOS-MK-07-07A]|jgi:hypothetical protein|nr:hypothetical protein [Tolypothrix brevis GSE-NOS-MK-07-07A]
MIGTDNNMDKQLVECLIEAGLITEEQLQSAKKQQQMTGKSIEEIVITQGLVKPETIVYFQDNLISLFAKNNSLEPPVSVNSNNFNISISAKGVFRIFLGIIGFLISAHLLIQLIQRFTPDFPLRDGLAELFNLDYELNFPSIYSALTLLFCSIILFAITSIKKKKDDSYTDYWRGLSIIFAFLAFDELTSMHERTIGPLKAALNTSGFLYFAWVIPGGIGVLLFLLIFLRFIINLPKKTRHHFLMAGSIYISGAIGCELVGGYIVDIYRNHTSFPYLFIYTLEEFLEMLGVAVFIYGLLSHISYCTQGTVLKIKFSGNKSRLSNSLSEI